LSEKEKEKRLLEITKNFKSLLGALESNYLWQYLGNMFVRLLQPLPFKTELTDEEEVSLTIEDRERRLYMESKRKEHLMLYPLVSSLVFITIYPSSRWWSSVYETRILMEIPIFEVDTYPDFSRRY
jgi:hypothetical protein